MKSGTRPCPGQRALLAWATHPRADASCPFARDGVVVTAPAVADRDLPPSFRRFWASAAAANVADGIRAGALPLIGALLFATAMFVPLAVDASALVVAVILVLTLPRAASTVAAPPAREGRPRLLTELLGGARGSWATPARGGDLRRLGHRLRRRRVVVGTGGLQGQRARAAGGRVRAAAGGRGGRRHGGGRLCGTARRTLPAAPGPDLLGPAVRAAGRRGRGERHHRRHRRVAVVFHLSGRTRP